MITDGLRKRNESKASKLHSQSCAVRKRSEGLLKPLTLVCLFLFVVAFSVNTAAGSTQTFTISGRVTDGYGNIISGATVTLSGTQSAVTTADSNGNYSFPNLQAGGNYDLSPSKAGQYFGFGGSVNNLSSDLIVNLRLDPYVAFNIRVTDASGNGIGAVAIQINDETLSPLTSSFGIVNILIGIAATNNNPPIKLTPQKPGYLFDPPSLTFNPQDGNQAVHFIGALSGLPVTFLQFSADRFTVNEGDGSATITVTRTGDTSTVVGVSYFTADAGVATQKSDYVMATGTLNFAPGETTKTFTVLIIDNAYVQGAHTLFLQLTNPTGGSFLGAQFTSYLTILDNDTGPATTNPLDTPQFFVREHYYDLLDRLPDQQGSDYWSSQIAQCGSDARCLTMKRTSVSAAFFIEQEFQQTGLVIYRLNKAAFGLIPSYSHFMQDRNCLIGGAGLPQSTIDFANAFVQTGTFVQFYPNSLSQTDFVDKLFDTAGLVPYTTERQQQIQAMSGGKTRAQVLLDVIEIPEFKNREYNPAFVLMQYYGYLRRDPDPDGYNFWLNVLNNKLPHDDSGYRAMVCAFITSFEYQDRFSPVRTHSNADCGP
jgi:hypothetical protein